LTERKAPGGEGKQTGERVQKTTAKRLDKNHKEIAHFYKERKEKGKSWTKMGNASFIVMFSDTADPLTQGRGGGVEGQF